METLTQLTAPDYFFDTTVLVAYFKDEDPYTVQAVEPVLRGEHTVRSDLRDHRCRGGCSR